MLRSNAAIDLSRRNVVDGAMEGVQAEYHMFIAQRLNGGCIIITMIRGASRELIYKIDTCHVSMLFVPISLHCYTTSRRFMPKNSNNLNSPKEGSHG